MTTHRFALPPLFAAALAALVGCAATGDGAGPGPGATGDYKTCTSETRAGEFVLRIQDTEPKFTGVQSAVVSDGVEQLRIRKVVGTFGACKLMQYREAPPPCAPACDLGTQNCVWMGARSACVAKVSPRDVGTVTLAGLKVPTLTLVKNAAHIYTNAPDSIPHPGFDEGATLVLAASGGETGYGPFMMKAWGVAALKTDMTPLLVENNKPVTLTWTPGKAGPTRILINFAINLHANTDTWLDCETQDTGSFKLEASVIAELYKYGTSGFPSVTLTRQSGDTAMVKSGCVEFLATSEINRPLKIPGQVDCMDDDVCKPLMKMCADDLTCK